MLFRLLCDCGAKMNVEVDMGRKPAHVSGMALALRAGAKQGFAYRNGRMGKSVVTVECARCRRGQALWLEADFLPSEATPGTFASDSAIPLDSAGAGGEDGGEGDLT